MELTKKQPSNSLVIRYAYQDVAKKIALLTENRNSHLLNAVSVSFSLNRLFS